MDAFPVTDIVTIPLPPLQSVDQITYVDTDGIEQVLAGSPAAFETYGIGGATPAKIAPLYNERWPATRRQGAAVSIDFTAGYATRGSVPAAIRAAIMLQAATLFDYREIPVPRDMAWTPAATNLLMPFRVWP